MNGWLMVRKSVGVGANHMSFECTYFVFSICFRIRSVGSVKLTACRATPFSEIACDFVFASIIIFVIQRPLEFSVEWRVQRKHKNIFTGAPTSNNNKRKGNRKELKNVALSAIRGNLKAIIIDETIN